MNKCIPLALILVLSSFAQAAEVQLGKAIPTAQIRDWRMKIKKSVDCREISDIPATYLCVTKTEDTMKRMLGRLSYFVESKAAGTIPPENDPVYQASPQANYGGHEIMARDLTAFYAKLEADCRTNAQVCPNKLEKELKENVINAAIKKGYSNYVVISVSAESQMAGVMLSHEILHARFFLSEAYQARVAKFWNEELTEDDRKGIRETLSHNYNLDQPAGELLMLNEFQAYILQAMPAYSELGQWAALAPKLNAYMGDFLPKFTPETYQE